MNPSVPLISEPRLMDPLERRSLIVCGTVQGVGFRPFIYRLAVRLGLSGFVRNDLTGVAIEVQGPSSSLAQFVESLEKERPPLAQIDSIESQSVPPQADIGFQILESNCAANGLVRILPDVGLCHRCQNELNDVRCRRFEYPFINCTECGPRFTIIQSAPYDRSRTTMGGFAMCEACRFEYEDPFDRRFHAQPTACPRCGPRLWLADRKGSRLHSADPIHDFALEICAGHIGALKGVGGFHLVCDATNPLTVATLRQRKHRPDKPFALMVDSTESARRFCDVSGKEQALLESPANPIVLLRRHSSRSAANSYPLCEGVAPGQESLGVMLPYTPLHVLLMKKSGNLPLVMTSGNRSDEPIAYENDEAIARLEGIADYFLLHDRPIQVRCDDSIVRVLAEDPVVLRRSRGYVPSPIPLPMICQNPILAVGGQQKGTFGLGSGREAILGHHLGDLDDFRSYETFRRDELHYENVFGIRPELLACDMHPDYTSTQYAEERSQRDGIRLVRIQHHHAHIASCMVENSIDEPVIGVAFDGTGYGATGPTLDGEYHSGESSIWGGEFLVADYQHFQRVGRLRYAALPGGNAAIREPWRMAVSHLLDTGLPPEEAMPNKLFADTASIRAMIDRRINSPATCSMGRLFDAVASLIGIRHRVTYEGQAASDLERLATDVAADIHYRYEIIRDAVQNAGSPIATSIIDTRPVFHAILNDSRKKLPTSLIARRFHSTIAEMVLEMCLHIRRQTSIGLVALSGGVFVNKILTGDVIDRLEHNRFRILRHRRVPPNDGGLSLGQLAIAARSDCH